LKRLVFLRRVTIAALLSLFISSCTKELSPIGLDLLDPLDLLTMGYSDTVSIVAYAIPEDSVNTTDMTYTRLGSMYDPIFGITTANAFSQLFLSGTRVRFGTNPVYDSAFLYLPYKGAYGDTLSNMTFRIYELTEKVADSFSYYSNSSLTYDLSKPLGEITFQPKPSDSSFYEGAKHEPTLRIPINANFGNSVFSADTSDLNTSTDFAKHFKGFCIIAEPQNTPGKGAIVTFDMPSDKSRLIMYYHNDEEDSLNYNFSISSGCNRFQNYDHNGYAEATPMLKEQILNNNISLGQQFLFAQGMAGVKIKIEFPYLKKWFDTEKYVINDAQLIIGNASVSDVFYNPSSVTLREVGEAGSTSPQDLVDVSTGIAYFDGSYNESANTYRFRIARYMQQVLTGKVNDNGLHLIIPNSNYATTRLVLNGTSSPQSDLKLYLRYSRVQ